MHNVGYFFLAYSLIAIGIAALFGYLHVRLRRLEAQIERLVGRGSKPDTNA
ncbi:MAG: hypothetical protein HY720_17105 [Planctomycetes bacterium]|nr:hypothetical protein [Planctomycetota bacterium]